MVEYKTVKVTKATYDRLDKARKTEKGTVDFNDVISWLLDEQERGDGDLAVRSLVGGVHKAAGPEK